MSKKQISSVKQAQILDKKAPQKIKIISDGNVLELKNSDLKNDIHSYVYVKSKYKKGELISFTGENLKLQLTNYFEVSNK